MVAWVDNRFEAQSPFAMLLRPHGPATAPAMTQFGPIVVNEPEYSGTPVSPRLSLVSGRSGAQAVNLSLQDASPALLEVFDVGGRRLWAREVSGVGPGTHEVRIGDGESYPSGVYMARLTQGSHTVRAHVAVIH